MKSHCIWAVLFAVLVASTPARAQDIQSSARLQPMQMDPAGVSQLKSYIHDAWATLTRSMTDCRSLPDTKLNQRPVMYLPADLAVPPEVQKLQTDCGVNVQHLPRVIFHLGELKPRDIPANGLLYLPNPYVVPGGRFNEMYGWDSYFIIRGLLLDKQDKLARGMIENFFFEIEHYGGVLNANRTYFLTRSQPPFLTSMIMNYYTQASAPAIEKREWLDKAYGYAQRDYALWTHEPSLAGDTGLARYYDFGEGPVPEMSDDPHYYSQVSSYMLLHPDQNYPYINLGGISSPGPAFTLQVCGETKSAAPDAQPCTDSPQRFSLTSDYYEGDRAMRESGFDISFRFGPFSGSTHHFAPVCLNSLLYKAETDMQQMAIILGKSEDAQRWKQRAQARQAAINKYLWNANKGMYFDYDFTRHQPSSYNYVTTFYPLWTGLASPQQAQAVAANLAVFERGGGVAMSDRVSGVQWDLPYGWAPLQLLTVEGLRRYHRDDAADRISREFVSTVLVNFLRDGTVREKYNVVTRTTDANVTAGYKANVVGFGWTNGVTINLLDGISHGQTTSATSGRTGR